MKLSKRANASVGIAAIVFIELPVKKLLKILRVQIQ
jgi:hypothetical protein